MFLHSPFSLKGSARSQQTGSSISLPACRRQNSLIQKGQFFTVFSAYQARQLSLMQIQRLPPGLSRKKALSKKMLRAKKQSKKASFFFSHPDYTVGTGILPQTLFSCLLCAASFTGSAARRRVADFYRRSGIPVFRAGKLTSLNWNRAPCPEELTVFYRELYAGEKEIASANSIPPLFTPLYHIMKRDGGKAEIFSLQRSFA